MCIYILYINISIYIYICVYIRIYSYTCIYIGNYVVVSGSEELNSVKAIQGTADLKIAYAAAKGATCKPKNILQSSDLAGRTLLPGVYCSASGALIISASTVTLDGAGNSSSQWIFQTATSLVTATATSFILQNGAQAKNVYWAIG
jgi:hypothetical protein